MPSPDAPPIIIWNHRWEFDKNPEAFFAALEAVEKQGLDFRLALLGENFQACPKPFLDAKERFKHRLVQYGYAQTRDDYEKWLGRGSIVISTAIQENFGMAVVEAIRHGCLPLLPDRLAYPEVLPEEYHDDFIYKDPADLENKLARLLSENQNLHQTRRALSGAMGRYSWENVIDEYDDILEGLTAAKDI